MKGTMTIEMSQGTNPLKADTVFKATHLKTKTRLALDFDKKTQANIHIQAATEEVIKALKLNGATIGLIQIEVSDAQAFGRFFNRCHVCFTKMGCSILPELDWGASEGVVEVEINEGTGNDLGFALELLYRMALRSSAKMSHTQHGLTLFDLKQATGVIFDLQNGVEGAKDLSDWVKGRELTMLAQAKLEKAVEAKAVRAAKAKDKPEPKPKTPAKATSKNSGKADPSIPGPVNTLTSSTDIAALIEENHPDMEIGGNNPKPKAKAKAKPKKVAASLTNLTSD